MTPQDFTTNADAWTAAIQHVAIAASTALVAIATAGAVAYVKLKPYFDKLKADIRDNSARIDQHDALQGVVTLPGDSKPSPAPTVQAAPVSTQQPSQTKAP